MQDTTRPELIQKPAILDLTNPIKAKKSNLKRETIEDEYNRMKGKRDQFLNRAKVFSTYTIPYMFPEENSGSSPDGSNTTGWQSFGAKAVSTAQNKITMTLFPPHSTFARLELTSKAKENLREGDEDIINAQGSLVEAEKRALLEHEKISGRVGLGEAIKHLIVAGNTCLYVPTNGSLINYPLSQYVTSRDKSSNMVRLIIEETKSIETFDPALQLLIKSKIREKGNSNHSGHHEVTLFTKAEYKSGYYIVSQEVVGEPVGNTYRIAPDNFPWIVLRWDSNYGEDYGRSLVELHASDFHVIQVLSEAIAKGMILMSDIKYLVRAGSVTDVEHLVNSPTGEFITGNIDDIGVLQLEKYADFTPISAVLEEYKRSVGQAFLMTSQVQRNAERVTAYEIRRDALENEQILGGSYTLLAGTLQRPYFTLLLRRVGFDLPSELVNTVLMTGVEALGKMGEMDKLMQFTEMMQLPASWPQTAQARVKWGDYMRYAANQLSFDAVFLMSDEEFRKAQETQQQQMQQQQLQEAAGKALPTVASSMMNQSGAQ